MTTITMLIPDTQWLSSNQRLHWAPKAKRTAWIRDLAGKEVALTGAASPTGRVRIIAHVGYASNGKADPANAYPTIKAAIDGLVAAGLLVEDNHEWVIGPDMRRDPTKAPRGHHTVRLEISEIDGENASNSREIDGDTPEPQAKTGQADRRKARKT